MPVTIHVAHTSPVNPTGSSPFITHSQLWAALERKVRRAQDFVPMFTDCRVLKEEGNVITRRAYIKDGQMVHVKDRYVEEVCTLYAPTKVDFLSPGNHNSLAQNIISDGGSFTDGDLNLTYVFDWTYPEIEAGSDEEKAKLEEQKKGAKIAVDKTLESIRGMIEKGSCKFIKFINSGRCT